MRLKILFIRLFLFLFLVSVWMTFLTAQASCGTIRTVTGTVTKVTDGDSIQLTTPEQTKLKIRLYGIDAPETPKINQHTGHVNKPGQPYGEESWKALENKIMGKQVKVDIIEFDKYRRAVCMVWSDEKNINLEMVQEGYAEAFIEYLKPPHRTQFLEAEQEAKSEKRGIWSLVEYERPRQFRKRLELKSFK